jgi:uncharacterized lipoprotein NlpE involved in copper resistance
MKKLIILIVLAVMLTGCESWVQKDETGSSPALNTVEGLRTANVASVPINPYAPWVEIALGLATVVLGGSYVKQNKKLGVTEKKYSAHKKAVAAVIHDKTAKVDGDDLYNSIGKERSKLGI